MDYFKDPVRRKERVEDFPRGTYITRTGLGWTEDDVVYYDTPLVSGAKKVSIIWNCIIRGNHDMKERRMAFNAPRCIRCGYTPL